MDNLYRRGAELNVPRLQSSEVQFHRGDVRDADTFPAGPFDILVECSAEPSVLAGVGSSPDYLIHTNLIGMYRCLEAARQWNAGVLFLSTSRVYPIAPLEHRAYVEEATRFSWTEADTPGVSPRGVSEALDMRGARSLYGYTKYAAELLVDEYRAAFGLKSVINRCGVIAGPWQFGKVDQRRDFAGWDGRLGHECGGPGNTASLRELTALCREAVGRELAIGSDPVQRPGDLRIFVADCARLFERTAWRPRRDVACIVNDTAEWVRQQSSVLQTL